MSRVPGIAEISSDYLNVLNHGGLTKPPESLAEYVCTGFAILYTVHELLLGYSNVIRNDSILALDTFKKKRCYICLSASQ